MDEAAQGALFIFMTQYVSCIQQGDHGLQMVEGVCLPCRLKIYVNIDWVRGIM